MRLFERLQYFVSVGIFSYQELLHLNQNHTIILHYLLLILIAVGYKQEGLRLIQLPFIATFLIHAVLYLVAGFRIFEWLFYGATLLALGCWILYGLGDYSKFTPSGPFRVGMKEFHSKEYQNDCAIFYPAANDGSGQLGVPLMTYGMDQFKGLMEVLKCNYPHMADLGPFGMKHLLSV